MKDQQVLQIRSKHVDDAVLAFKNTGMAHPSDGQTALDAAAHRDAMQVKQFLDTNTNGAFRAAFQELFMHDVFAAAIRACPKEFYMRIEAETGQEVLCLLSDDSILLRGPQIIEPMNKSVTNGNTVSNEEIPFTEEPEQNEEPEPYRHDNPF